MLTLEVAVIEIQPLMPSIHAPSLDSAKLALERHAQNFLCLHILARRNIGYMELLEKLHTKDPRSPDIPPHRLFDDSYWCRVPPLELQTPFGEVLTDKFSVLVIVPGITSQHFPSAYHYTLGYSLERAYERLQQGYARVSEGACPAWLYRADRGEFERSRACEPDVFDLLELLARGVDVRLQGIQKHHASEAEKYRLQPRLRRVARGEAVRAWRDAERLFLARDEG